MVDNTNQQFGQIAAKSSLPFSPKYINPSAALPKLYRVSSSPFWSLGLLVALLVSSGIMTDASEDCPHSQPGFSPLPFARKLQLQTNVSSLVDTSVFRDRLFPADVCAASQQIRKFRGGSSSSTSNNRRFSIQRIQPKNLIAWRNSKNNSRPLLPPPPPKKVQKVTVVTAKNATRTSSISPVQRIQNIPVENIITATLASTMLGIVVFKNREALKPFLDKHYIQQRALVLLKDLEQQRNSLMIYVLGMACWELVGLSTIPVETAAGMVFGLRRGVLASGSGKLLGAFVAFGLGRYWLAQPVRAKLDQNPVWKTLDKSTEVHSRLNVALLMKFSCFPEMIKNFGSACLDLSFWQFAVATTFHGLLFTAVWTYLGVDTARRLEFPDLPMNIPLQATLAMAAVAGLVISPLLMAWWIRDMKNRAT